MRRRDFRILEQERLARRVLNRKGVDKGIKKFLAISGLSLVVLTWIVAYDIPMLPKENNKELDFETGRIIEKRVEIEDDNINNGEKEYNAINHLLNKAYDTVVDVKENLDDFNFEIVD